MNPLDIDSLIDIMKIQTKVNLLRSKDVKAYGQFRQELSRQYNDLIQRINRSLDLSIQTCSADIFIQRKQIDALCFKYDARFGHVIGPSQFKLDGARYACATLSLAVADALHSIWKRHKNNYDQFRRRVLEEEDWDYVTRRGIMAYTTWATVTRKTSQQGGLTSNMPHAGELEKIVLPIYHQAMVLGSDFENKLLNVENIDETISVLIAKVQSTKQPIGSSFTQNRSTCCIVILPFSSQDQPTDQIKILIYDSHGNMCKDKAFLVCFAFGSQDSNGKWTASTEIISKVAEYIHIVLTNNVSVRSESDIRQFQMDDDDDIMEISQQVTYSSVTITWK